MIFIGILIGGFIGAIGMALFAMSDSNDMYGYEVKSFLRQCVGSDWTQGDHLAIRKKAQSLLMRIYEEEM